MGEKWFGVHLTVSTDEGIRALTNEVPALAKLSINVLIPEVNYGYAFESHPELRGENPITKSTARALKAACDAYSIRLIPQFQCLGHQSWAEKTHPLLIHYPQFDETPGQYPHNEDIYCRSWCPQHPDVNPIIFDLFDELLDAFKPDAMHVGMDEVFLIGSEYCPRCKGEDPAKLFAMATNDYYDHLVKKRGVEMLMWGDRLLNADETGYGKWEAATNGTDPAIDMIPTDIVICDWHYEKMNAYPSVPILLEKGFRVWPAGWKEVEAVEGLITYAQQYADDARMLGHLSTVWGQVMPGELAEWPPVQIAARAMQGI